jgi:hypothetical protein
MRHTLAVAVFVAALVFSLRPAQAYGSAPWCAVIDVGWGDVVWDCQYHTFEACVPNVLAGNRGFCNLNPAGPGWQWRGANRTRHHHKRHINPH